MPNVSVIIPTYKRDHLVSQAIETVLAQTYTDYEIIVVNDGSPDNTKEVLASFEDKITIIHQENQGVSTARNTGIEAAKGKYIAFLDDDDLWVSNKLEKQIAYLEAHPNIGMIYSDQFVIYENGVKSSMAALDTKIPVPPYEDVTTLFVRSNLGTSTVIVQKKCLDKVGWFDQTMRTGEDYDLWVRIAEEKYPIHFLNEPLGYWRPTPNSLSRNNYDETMLYDFINYKKKVLERNPSLQQLPHLVLEQCFYSVYQLFHYIYISDHKYDMARLVLEEHRQLYRAYYERLITRLFCEML